MPTPSLCNAQENCHWLALAGSFFILASTIVLTVLWPAESQALDVKSETDLVSLSGAYQSPRRCRECHAAEFQAWSGTSHARASFDPDFQTWLQLEQEPGECFSCHTTGYDPTTGRFALAGVTCETCHGPYRPGHPGENMPVAENLCTACHTNDRAGWASSHHDKSDLTCSACHEVHTQQTR